MLDLAGKIPPHSLDAEQALLASMLIARDVTGLVADILEPRHFYRTGHGLLYGAMRQLYQADSPIDFITVGHAMGERLAEVGGPGYLIDLVGSIPTASRAEHYAGIVKDKAVLRDLIAAGIGIAQAAYEPAASSEDVQSSALSTITGLEPASGRDEDEDMGDFLQGYIARIEERADSKTARYLASGWHDVDYVWTAAKGDLVLLAARPAVGKTAFALNYAWNVAQHSRVDFWSLEMDKDALMNRIVQRLERIESDRLKSGKLTREEWEALARATRRIESSGLTIRKPNSLTAAGVRRATLKAQARGKGPALVVIDYIGLMNHPRADRHDLAVAATSRALKLFAGEAKVAVFALAQLNRGTDKNDNKRPALTNLRDSGALEQDADGVLFLHREAYYDPKADQEGLCEVIVAKHRNGSTGTVPLLFKPSRQTFEDPPPDLPPLDDDDAPRDWRTE